MDEIDRRLADLRRRNQRHRQQLDELRQLRLDAYEKADRVSAAVWQTIETANILRDETLTRRRLGE